MMLLIIFYVEIWQKNCLIDYTDLAAFGSIFLHRDARIFHVEVGVESSIKMRFPPKVTSHALGCRGV